MDIERALEINGLVVQAFLHQQGITDDLPDFDDVTPADVLEAARLAIDAPGRKNPDGSTSIHMRFERTESVTKSYAYAVFHKQRPTSLAQIV